MKSQHVLTTVISLITAYSEVIPEERKPLLTPEKKRMFLKTLWNSLEFYLYCRVACKATLGTLSKSALAMEMHVPRTTRSWKQHSSRDLLKDLLPSPKVEAKISVPVQGYELGTWKFYSKQVFQNLSAWADVTDEYDVFSKSFILIKESLEYKRQSEESCIVENYYHENC